MSLLQPSTLRPFPDLVVFRSWLEARTDQIVGLSADEWNCPLAWFLSEQFGMPYQVGYAIYGLLDGASAPLPAWASAFVRALDFTYPYVEVTGQQMLVLLSEGVMCSSHGCADESEEIQPGRLYTFGYTVRGADVRLAELMTDPLMTLLDIRRSPRSRYRPSFRRSSLEQQFPARYYHVPELGNVNYADRTLPIVLVDASAGLRALRFWLERGYSVCLLCACAHLEDCHRRVVAELVTEQYPCEVVHL